MSKTNASLGRSIGARRGTTDGEVAGILDNIRGARDAFIRRLDLPESEWPAYRDAYDAAYRAAKQLMSHPGGVRNLSRRSA